MPVDFIDANILQSEFHDEIHKKIIEDKVKLHKDFHHLNSSQAMCFNLFYPIVIEERFNILSDILDVRFDEIHDVYFEYVYDKEEQTNFDFYIKDKNQKLFFEVKYTEQKFTSQKIDESHINKYNNLYKERLKIFKSLDMENFFKNYQLFRNLIYISSGTVVFIIPGIREDLKRSIIQVCEKYLNIEQQNRVKTIFIEEIVYAIISNDDKLKNYYVMFKDKYIFW